MLLSCAENSALLRRLLLQLLVIPSYLPPLLLGSLWQSDRLHLSVETACSHRIPSQPRHEVPRAKRSDWDFCVRTLNLNGL